MSIIKRLLQYIIVSVVTMGSFAWTVAYAAEGWIQTSPSREPSLSSSTPNSEALTPTSSPVSSVNSVNNPTKNHSNIDLNLYQAEITLPDSSDAERDKAFPILLQKVLVKVSTNSKAGTLSQIQPELKHADQYVEQFSYVHAPQATTSSLDKNSNLPSTEIILRAIFNPAKVNALLTKAKQPIHNSSRPLVVVWFAIHNKEGHDDIVNSLSDNTFLTELSKSLREESNNIGLPIALPFWDLEDITAVELSDWSKITPEELKDASKRYEADAILLIKMNASKKSTCTSQWSLLTQVNNETDEVKPSHWKENLKTCQASIRDGMIQTLHDVLLSPSLKSPENNELIGLDVQKNQTLHVSVSNIQSVQDYQQVLSTMQKQPNVVDVQIEKVSPSCVVYLVHVKDNMNHFAENMQNHPQFQLLNKNSASKTVEYEFISTASSNNWKEQ